MVKGEQETEVSMRVLLTLLLLLLSIKGAQAAEGTHKDFHWFYKDLTKRGMSCCNDKDCRPVDARYVDNHWEVFIPEGKDWYPVPNESILNVFSPDNQVHACYTILPSDSVLDHDGNRGETFDVYIRCLTLPGSV